MVYDEAISALVLLGTARYTPKKLAFLAEGNVGFSSRGYLLMSHVTFKNLLVGTT
jgi:hypothetical protein